MLRVVISVRYLHREHDFFDLDDEVDELDEAAGAGAGGAGGAGAGGGGGGGPQIDSLAESANTPRKSGLVIRSSESTVASTAKDNSVTQATVSKRSTW